MLSSRQRLALGACTFPRRAQLFTTPNGMVGSQSCSQHARVICPLQAQLEEIRALRTGGTQAGGAAEQLDAPARATAVATETVCLDV